MKRRKKHEPKKDLCFIGIDNGVTGTIGIIDSVSSIMVKMPTKTEQSYTKKKGNITRIDVPALHAFLYSFSKYSKIAGIERPMVNPGRFKASVSALRALEATIIVLEELKIPYVYLDSKEWQKELLPQGTKTAPQLKKASLDICKRMFPHMHEFAKKHKDADGLLIAEYMRRKYR